MGEHHPWPVMIAMDAAGAQFLDESFDTVFEIIRNSTRQGDGNGVTSLSTHSGEGFRSQHRDRRNSQGHLYVPRIVWR